MLCGIVLNFARVRRGIISPFHAQANPRPCDWLSEVEPFVIHTKAPHGNSVDGHTLGPVITKLEKLTAGEIRRIYVDKGYRRVQSPTEVSHVDQRRVGCPATPRPRGPARSVEGIGSRPRTGEQPGL